jgi:thiol-disulfide isomerase/thioredoxin
MRLATACIVLAALLLAGCGSSHPKSAAPSRTAEQKAFQGSPPQLVAVHNQGSDLLEGGTSAFDQRIAQLKGHPVVVNKWASWCGPCRQEFPIFQHVATKLGKQVAFMGINANDHDTAARHFLRNEALPYPSFSDENLAISGKLGIVPIFPTTVFFDANGKRQYIHQGYYTSTAQLTADIRRYAIGAS